MRNNILKVSCIGLVAMLGCGLDESGDDSLDEDASDPAALFAARRGVDYAWSKPSAQTLKAQGYTFAARYLSYDTSGKNISVGEANALKAAGLDIVVVWENGAGDALAGYSRGVSDAQAAQARANAVGMPAGRPIYFAVDFDASAGQQGAINSYFDGAASVLGRGRVGAYAGYYPIKRLFDAGKIAWGWQTYAWSAGQWDGRAQLRQTLNGVNIGGADCDIDWAQKADFGQWNAPRRESVTTDVGKVVAAANADGRLEVFWIDAASNIQHAWQTTPNGSWSHGAALGGKAKLLTVAPNRDGRLDLVYIGTDDKLYHRYQDSDGWSNEVGFGVRASALALGRNDDGRLELVYAAATDATIHHIWQTVPNGGWSNGATLGGKAKTLRVGANEDGRLEVVYVGTDDKLYHRWQTEPNGSWSNEAGLRGAGTTLSVARNADGRLEVAYADGTAALKHLWQSAPNDAWTPGFALGGKAKRVTLLGNDDGRLEAIYVGTDDKLYHRWQTTPNGSWSNEAGLGHAGRDVTVARNRDGRLEIFYATPNGNLAHMWQKPGGGGWTGGSLLDGSVKQVGGGGEVEDLGDLDAEIGTDM